MKSERTREGNPNQLTIQQHVFPLSAIERFAGDDGGVLVRLRWKGFTFRARADNPIFCAERAWDQTTETTRSHSIEESYASLADGIVAGTVKHLLPSMDDVVTRFYALWSERHRARKSPVGDTTMKGATPEPPLTKDQEENLESNGYVFARGTVMPSRMMTGISMMVGMDRRNIAMRGVHWGIVRSESAQFVVPDNAERLGVVPVAPTVCLCQGLDDAIITAPDVALINRLALEGAHAYYFANDLDRCPIQRRTLPFDAFPECTIKVRHESI
jgi:hypothetical protein